MTLRTSHPRTASHRRPSRDRSDRAAPVLSRKAIVARGYSKHAADRILAEIGFTVPGGRKRWVRADLLERWERERSGPERVGV